MYDVKRIVCPTDFSAGAAHAIAKAVELALGSEVAIDLVHVLPRAAVLPNDTHFALKVPEFERALHAEAAQQLRDVARSVEAKGVQTRTFIAHGDPASEIVRIAERERAELIVIATYGRTGWRRFVFGSVAEKVVRLAHCPVLTLRGGAMSNEAAA